MEKKKIFKCMNEHWRDERSSPRWAQKIPENTNGSVQKVTPKESEKYLCFPAFKQTTESLYMTVNIYTTDCL